MFIKSYDGREFIDIHATTYVIKQKINGDFCVDAYAAQPDRWIRLLYNANEHDADVLIERIERSKDK